jgi:dihydroflavonol-4-reductase
VNEEQVLVTGGTGFIAQHCMLALLAAGYRVRTTVRNLSRSDEVLGNLKTGGQNQAVGSRSCWPT